MQSWLVRKVNFSEIIFWRIDDTQAAKKFWKFVQIVSLFHVSPGKKKKKKSLIKLSCTLLQQSRLHVCVFCVRAENGGHSQLPKVTGGVKGQLGLIGRDVLPWDLNPLRDNPLIGVS